MRISDRFRVLGLLGFFSVASTFAATPNLRVGFSKVDITPDFQRFGPIHLGGFAPYYPVPFKKNRWAVGIHDPIWARAIAIQGEGEKTVILISADLPGLAWKYINPVRREIERVFHIPQANVIIASTHNHAGPDAIGYWSTTLPGHNKEYTTQLKQWLFSAAARAIQNLEPADMTTLTTSHYACYDPKTRELKKDPYCNIPANSTDYRSKSTTHYDSLLIQKDKRDPIVRNTNITVAYFTRPETGDTLGTFINWHNHPDTLGGKNLFLSSDFPHYLRQYVETKLGGMAVYFSGTVGCQIGAGSPIPLWTREMEPVFERGPMGTPVRKFVGTNAWEKIRSIGYEIGNEVVEAVRTRHTSTHGSTFKRTAPITIKTEPLDIAPTNILHALTTGPVWHFDVEPVDRIHRYATRCMGRFGCVRSDVSILQIGDLSVVTGPAEIDPAYIYGRAESTADYGGKYGNWHFPAMPGIRDWMKGPHIAVLGQANNYLSYMIPRSDNVGALKFKHPNHYEEFVTVNKHLGDDLGNKWMQMLGSSVRYNSRKILPETRKPQKPGN